MTLTIVFSIAVLIGIAFCIWDYYDNCFSDWKPVVGWTIIAICGIALFINLAVWIPSKRNSEICHQQYIQEKQTIEVMLQTDNNVDRLLLNDRVIEYNNKIISVRENSKRYVWQDYYSKDVDWDALELIEWK